MPNYDAQKKYLSGKKQLRVWVDSDKYTAFKEAVENNGESIYSAVNTFIDAYLKRG